MKTLEFSPSSLGASPAELPQSATPASKRRDDTLAVGSNTVRCTHCDKNVAYHYSTINHKKQLFLTVFTIGLWLPLWLGMTLCPTKLCNECGGPIWND